MRSSILSLTLLAGVPAVAIVGCSNAPQTMAGQQELDNSAQRALGEALRRDPSLRQKLDNAAGYAVFPTVGEGGFIIGGGYGKGVLYEQHQPVGYCDITNLSAGAKIGGQSYSQIIIFETQKPLADFKNGRFSFAADASAVALREGAAASTQFKENVAVFVYDQGGLMADASIGGETFRFTPLEVAQQAASTIEGEVTEQQRQRHQQQLQQHRQDMNMQSGQQRDVDVNIQRDNRDRPSVDVQVD